MKNRYDISVIIPLYNAGKLVCDAFESLLGQTIGFERIQVIIVDDCSTDESAEIVKDYEQKYDNVHVWKTESNSGAAGKPRNIGLDHVSAPYVMFLDPDDLYVDDACQKLFEKIRDTRADFVGGSYWRIDKNGANPVLGDENLPQQLVVYELPHDVEEAIQNRGPLWTKIFRAQFLKENGIRFLPSGYGQDTAFVCECIVNATRYVFIPDKICFYRYNESSVTRIINESFFAKNLNSVKRCSEVLRPYQDAQKKLLRHLYCYYYWTLILARNIDKKTAVRILSDYPELFGNVDQAVPSIRILSILLSNGQQGIAAEYIAQLRLSYDMQAEIEQDKRQIHGLQVQKEEYRREKEELIESCSRQIEEVREAYKNRIVVRIADALEEKQFSKVFGLGYEFLKKHLSGTYRSNG